MLRDSDDVCRDGFVKCLSFLYTQQSQPHATGPHATPAPVYAMSHGSATPSSKGTPCASIPFLAWTSKVWRHKTWDTGCADTDEGSYFYVVSKLPTENMHELCNVAERIKPVTILLQILFTDFPGKRFLHLPKKMPASIWSISWLLVECFCFHNAWTVVREMKI